MAEKTGRPEKTPEEKQVILSKLEPLLKSGLSIRKSLLQTGVASATFYRIMDRDESFRENVNAFRQFLSIMLNNAMVRHLQQIVEAQREGKAISKLDINFMKWFAINSNATKGEYGERKEIGLYDPEIEIQRIAGLIDEVSKPHEDAPKK